MIRFGILGFGLHAVKRLMPGFAAAKNSRVTALSRREIGKARESAKQFDIPHAFDSAEKMCRSKDVDAVFVTTPNACHLDDVLLALRCGKPVLCEKPMGINADQCRRMVEAARKANLLLGVAQVFRFENSTARLRERIAAGELGKVIFARSEFSFAASPDHPRKWINDPKVAGGGPIADVGVHCVDMLRFLLQDEVVRVTARGRQDSISKPQEAAATLILEFERGTLATVMVSFRADYRTPVEFVGDKGILRADDALNVEYPITLSLKRGAEIVDTETLTNQSVYARQVDSFAAAFEGGPEFPVPGEQGWQNQVILDAAYKSIKSGRAEPVKRVI
jgi:1,5-anhydro-D-fructose reductase (1,5-anhydro-D-mannitol-forming)